MAKDRVTIPSDVAARVLFASDNTCCVCREPGRAVQLHHIDEDPGNNDPDNLCVLCLLCHDQTQTKGGFGRKLNASAVIQYRDDWLPRIVTRRDSADQLAALRMSGTGAVTATTEDEAVALMIPADEALVAYVKALPDALARAYSIARPQWDTGVTSEMLQGTYDVIDVVVQMLTHLASWFTEKHFDNQPAHEYFSRYVSTRFGWHRALAEPDGIGTGGTIVGPSAAAAVLADVERAVDEMVTALLWGREGFSLKSWRQRWEAAK